MGRIYTADCAQNRIDSGFPNCLNINDGEVGNVIFVVGILAILLGGVLMALNHLNRPKNSGKAPRSGKEVYDGLRDMALATKPATIGVDPSAENPVVFGVLMDMVMDHGTATLVGWASGEGSLYTSTGGGVIGAGLTDQAAHAAACDWVRIAQEYLALFAPTTTYPIASDGNISIYILTTHGVFAANGPKSEIAERVHPISPVWVGGQVLIDRIRRATEAAKAKGTARTLSRKPT